MTLRCSPSGPKDAKIALVGEAPGAEEDGKTPFLGYSGQELTQIGREAKLVVKRSDVEEGQLTDECYLTNVFMERPPDNKLQLHWCMGKKEASEKYKEVRDSLINQRPEVNWPSTYTWSLISQGAYIDPERLPELYRLREELVALKPNLVVALGGTAFWALCDTSGITKARGTVRFSTLIPGLKVLPAYHPAYVTRMWDARLTLVADLAKAKLEKEFPDIRLPKREIWINPQIQDIETFINLYIKDCSLLAFDTETARKQITCISFAPSKDLAIVIPFVDKSRSDYRYWSTKEREVKAWKLVRDILDLPMPKLAQNGLYDLQYLWKCHGIPVRNFFEDTMLLHHALYLELPKDLGFLGSIYTSEASWKLMRHREKDEVEKKDD